MPDRAIVLEGPDGMGKSTLLKKLQLAFPDFEVLHTGGPKTDKELDETCTRVEMTPGNILLDRAPHVSEIVYRPLKEGFRAFTRWEETLWLSRFSDVAPVLLVVVCRTNAEKAREGLVVEVRPHKSAAWWDKVLLNYDHIVREYDRLTKSLRTFARVYEYDWEKDPQASDLVAWLTKHI